MRSRRETIEMKGIIREALPNGLYRVELAGDARGTVTAHVAGGGALLRLLPGDGVVVELAAYDMSRGRIVRRSK
jgi:translation initiation factor IF-1